MLSTVPTVVEKIISKTWLVVDIMGDRICIIRLGLPLSAFLTGQACMTSYGFGYPQASVGRFGEILDVLISKLEHVVRTLDNTRTYSRHLTAASEKLW
jgi:hypothetical protein